MAPGAACTSVTCGCESTQKIMMTSCTYIFSDPTLGSETTGGWAKKTSYISKQYRNHLINLLQQTPVHKCLSNTVFFDPALTQLCQTFRFALWWMTRMTGGKTKSRKMLSFSRGQAKSLVRPSNSPWPCPFRTRSILYITHTTQPLLSIRIYLYHIQPQHCAK